MLTRATMSSPCSTLRNHPVSITPKFKQQTLACKSTPFLGSAASLLPKTSPLVAPRHRTPTQTQAFVGPELAQTLTQAAGTAAILGASGTAGAMAGLMMLIFQSSIGRIDICVAGATGIGAALGVAHLLGLF